MTNPKKNVNRFFDSDASDYLQHKYAGRGNSFMALRRQKAAGIVSRHLAPLFNDRYRFLDCGCGPGILLDVLASQKIEYWAVDLSAEMLKLAARQPESGACHLSEKRLLRGDVEKLPFASESFDAAASLGVIEYLAADDGLLAEMVRVVKPNGYVLIAVTNRESYNLLLERPLNWMRKSRAANTLFNRVKLGLGLGQFRPADFEKRRHLPLAFADSLASRGLELVESASWGLNFLPHPLHYLCPDRWNDFANAFYERSNSSAVKRRGEGFIALCRRVEGSHGRD